MFPEFNKRQFSHIVTGDKTLLVHEHYTEPGKSTGYGKLNTVVAQKKTISIKEVLCWIFSHVMVYM